MEMPWPQREHLTGLPAGVLLETCIAARHFGQETLRGMADYLRGKAASVAASARRAG